jgi:hypothetical protein
MKSNQNNKKIRRDGGQAMMIFVTFFLFISLSIVVGIIAPVVSSFAITKDTIASNRSYYLAESGVEDAVYRVKNAMSISVSETLSYDGISAVTTITDLSGNEKQIQSLAEDSSRERQVTAIVQASDGVSFNYGLQTGTGGLSMTNNSGVYGNVYSNGWIFGSNSSFITGTAYSADGADSQIDQSNTTPEAPPYSVTFGTANATQDFAQSFVPTIPQYVAGQNNQVTKARVYIRKVGNPANATLHIMSNHSSGRPLSSICSGVLSASLVTTSFGWIEVPISTTCGVATGTTYWVMIDVASNNASNYYQMAGNMDYATGGGKLGRTTTWVNTSPAGIDGYFEFYVGGVQGRISGMIVGTGGVGDTHAYNIINSTIAGTNYCQTGSGNNKVCNTTGPDTPQASLPISDALIDSWKSQALEGGTHSGNYLLSNNQVASLGPKYISGNLQLSNNAVLTVTGTLHVHGSLMLSNDTTIQLDPAYGSGSGVIVVDGTVNISNNADFNGSGVAGSYVALVTLSTTNPTINVSNNAGTVILYAPNGNINFSNNAGAKSAIGKTITLSNNATITYESGLADVNFVNGPSGSYGIQSWRETE